MDISKKNDMQVAQDYASKSDVEEQIVGTSYEVKRDLSRRHINMIAIAGMIVCDLTTANSCFSTVLTCVFRALDFF